MLSAVASLKMETPPPLALQLIISIVTDQPQLTDL